MDRPHFHYKLILFGAGMLLCLLLLSAYSNSLYAPFVLDDVHSFVEEPKIIGFTGDLSGIKELASTKFGIYRFLPILTLALDSKWGGGNVAAFHITNILIHFLATFSLLFLFLSLFSLSKSKLSLQIKENRNIYAILVVTVVGLWSLNPVQTNAVTYIVQRMTSIATLFYFLSFSCYLRGRYYHIADGLSKKSLFFYFLTLLFFACAMMSKEIAATLPVMFLLVEYLIVEDSGLIKFIKKHRLIIVLFSVLIIVLVFYKISQGWLLGGYSRRHFTLLERLLTELRIVSSYCALLLLPLPVWLNLEHDVALSTSLFSPWTTFFSLIFIVSVIVVAWKMRHEQPLLVFCGLWFFVNLLIESSIIPLELKFEHRLYLPSAGFYLGVILGLYELYVYFNGNKFSIDKVKLFACVAVIICSGLSFLTYTRNVVWADTVSLYSDCIVKAPGKARSHSNLSTSWLKKGKYEKSLPEAEKAINLGVRGYEEYWVAGCDVITSLRLMDKDKEAITRGELLIEEAPERAKKNAYPTFIFNLGYAYFDCGEFQSAFDYFLDGYKLCYRNDLPKGANFVLALEKTLTTGLQQGYQFEPDIKLNTDNLDVAVKEKMAQIFFDLNNYDLALKYVETIMAKGDNSLLVSEMKETIELIAASNEQQKKLESLKEKYFYHPFASQFNLFMALSYTMEKYNIPTDSFLQYCLRQAEILNDGSPDLYIVKSWYFYKLGEYDEALEIVDLGIKLNPDYSRLWVNRGIYALAAKNSEAYDDFNKALALYPSNPHRAKILVMQTSAEKLMGQSVVAE